MLSSVILSFCIDIYPTGIPLHHAMKKMCRSLNCFSRLCLEYIHSIIYSTCSAVSILLYVFLKTTSAIDLIT